MSILLGRTFACRGLGYVNFKSGSLRQIQILSSGSLAIRSNISKESEERRSLVKAPTKQLFTISKRFSHDGDHVRLWTAEKILSGALIPIFPLAFICQCAPLDYLLCLALTIHSHWGIEAIVVDYIRPSVFGEMIPKLGVGLVYAFSALTLGALFYFTYTDVGIVNAVKMLWKL